MAERQELSNLYAQLAAEHKKGFSDTKKCSDILEKLKVGLTKIAYLPSVGVPSVKPDLQLGRDILEMGALFSISANDIPAFERFMAQLKSYYLDYSNDLPESPMKYELLGLNLLWLLTQNRVAEFHTELELLSPNDIQNNVFIHYPVSLEQHLMEGSYNKIFVARSSVPAPSFTYFLNILVDTIRDEIAACMEKSYDKIHVSEAAKMLRISSVNAVQEYGKKRDWLLGTGDFYTFQIDIKKTDDALSAMELAKQTIEYARELEMIV